MIASNSFASCALGCIPAMNSSRLGTSISETTVQYRSALTSVMTRIFPIPRFSPIFAIARNFSTIGRTLPALQYMTSRMRSMFVFLAAGVVHVDLVTVETAADRVPGQASPKSAPIEQQLLAVAHNAVAEASALAVQYAREPVEVFRRRRTQS